MDETENAIPIPLERVINPSGTPIRIKIMMAKERANFL